jgi:hypothetical protein
MGERRTGNTLPPLSFCITTRFAVWEFQHVAPVFVSPHVELTVEDVCKRLTSTLRVASLMICVCLLSRFFSCVPHKIPTRESAAGWEVVVASENMPLWHLGWCWSVPKRACWLPPRRLVQKFPGGLYSRLAWNDAQNTSLLSGLSSTFRWDDQHVMSFRTCWWSELTAGF